jgi:tetratricopeptide (TPR) repeat protein
MSNATKKLSVFATLLLCIPFLSYVNAQDLDAAIKLTKSEQFTPAASMFRKLIQENPANGDLYYYYGRNCMEKYDSDTLNVSFQEKADSAKMIFETGIRQDPTNPMNFVGLGGLALINKDLAGAKTEFDKALALLPSKANKAIKMEPSRQAKILVQMAASYVMANVKDTASAFTYLRRAEQLDKKYPELYIVEGDVWFYLLNNGSQAISNYNMAQTLDPTSPEAKLKIGQLWLRARNYKDALVWYQEVVKMDSTFAPAYRELGTLLARAGRQEEAKKNFRKFLELSRNTGARKQYVNTLIELKDYNDAIEQLMEIKKVDTDDNDVNRALAYSYFETQQYEKALSYAEQFIANAKPEKIRYSDYAYYGRILAKLKMDTLATVQLMKAYSMDTSKTELISEAAFCWTKAKKYDKARDLYQSKVDMKSATAMDYYNLGKVYYSLGDYVNSDTNLAVFNSLQPDYIAGWVWRARTKSNIDSTSKLGLAKPIYDIILEKTQSDTVKNVKERMEAYYYLAFYNFLQYNATKEKEYAVKAVEYGNRVIAIDPKDDKALKAKQIVDALKDKAK